jgi:hypothetical protein
MYGVEGQIFDDAERSGCGQPWIRLLTGMRRGRSSVLPVKYFDLICNRGNFNTFGPLIWQDGSPFEKLMTLSEWLYKKTGRTHSIALNKLAMLLFELVTSYNRVDAAEAANRLFIDFTSNGRRGFPNAVARYVTERPQLERIDEVAALPARQMRHRR